MKKETKRYLIVEYAGTKERVFETKEELDKMINDTRKYNNRKNSKYICGNMDIQLIEGTYHVTIHLYNKLTNKNTISDIDNFTKNFDKKELIAFFEDKSKMKEGIEPDINIAYFESKDSKDKRRNNLLFGIKYIPVLYKDDTKYLDDLFIEKCLKYHALNSDVSFFKELANEFCYYHVVSDEIEKLYLYADKVKYQNFPKMSLYSISHDLYKKLIYERQRDGSILRNENGEYEISTRRKRDFAFFLKNYNSRKKNSPLQYNGSKTAMRKEELIKLRNALLERENIKSLKLK